MAQRKEDALPLELKELLPDTIRERHRRLRLRATQRRCVRESGRLDRMLRVEADARGLKQLGELGIARRGHADRLRASSVDEPRPLDLANDLRRDVAELWRGEKLDEGDARTLGAALVRFDEEADLEGRMTAWWW